MNSKASIDTKQSIELKDNVVDRPTWRQSEKDIGKDFPNYGAQKSFLDGNEVPYGTKGSVRPEYYKFGHSIEVKNYNIETNQGRNNLVNNISKQIKQRIANLPRDTKQTIIIDIRGQHITNSILRELKERIISKFDIEVEILFKK